SHSIDASSARINPGVAPLRAGQGYSFVLRRLHSLSGIVPIGAFLLEHFISNSEAANGVQAYNDQVKFLTSLPFVHLLEWVFIFIPLLYHILYHVIDMRFTGVHLMGCGYQYAFSKVWFDFQHPWIVAFYVIGIVAASWHFSYGVWLFAAKWGLTVGANARRKFGYVCLVLAVALIGIGIWSIVGFVSTPADQVPWVMHD